MLNIPAALFTKYNLLLNKKPANYDICTIQELLGHSDVRTTHELCGGEAVCTIDLLC